MATPQEFLQFMPIGPTHESKNDTRAATGEHQPRKTPKEDAHKTAQEDQERSPERQRARRLGKHGAEVLRDNIKVDYGKNCDEWKKHAKLVVTQFSTALGQQADVLEKVKEERRAAAELQMFIFSLLTAGVMRFAGTYIQYITYPKLFSYKQVSQTTVTKLKRGPYTDTYTTTKSFMINARAWDVSGAAPTAIETDKRLAAFFGGVVQDVGNQAIGRYMTKKFDGDPFANMAEGDRVSMVRLADDMMSELLDFGKKEVEKQMDTAIFWMEQSPDFGAAWSTFCGDNETLARKSIIDRLEAVRNEWGTKWPCFGQTPKPFVATDLADAIERALWAAHIQGAMLNSTDKSKVIPRGEMAEKLLNMPENDDPRVPKSDMGAMVLTDGLGVAIVNRLRQLNVVIENTVSGAARQGTKIHGAAPKPAVWVEGDVDKYAEEKSLWKWASAYPKDSLSAIKSAGTEGIPRKMPDIPRY